VFLVQNFWRAGARIGAFKSSEKFQMRQIRPEIFWQLVMDIRRYRLPAMMRPWLVLQHRCSPSSERARRCLSQRSSSRSARSGHLFTVACCTSGVWYWDVAPFAAASNFRSDQSEADMPHRWQAVSIRRKSLNPR
jgi:hypothetical protein